MLRSAMNHALQFSRKATAVVGFGAAITLAMIALRPASGEPENKDVPPEASTGAHGAAAEQVVDLAPSQLKAVKIEPVGSYSFPVEKEALGSIDYDEDLSVQVFSPYQGHIVSALVNLGDHVEKGQPLYTVASADLDLTQAESSLIQAAATYDVATKAVEANRSSGSQIPPAARKAAKEAVQAEVALKAARDAVRLFGKTDAEIEQIAATRTIDTARVVLSPVSGQVTARNAQPGLFVQQGTSPAPYAVADLSTKWMVANVTEGDSPLFHVGQPIRARVLAFPGRTFEGKISRMGEAVDPNTHRVMVRCDVEDPKNELRPGMLASFVIQTQEPMESVAIPMNGVVRNGDGTMAAWVTTDRRRFSQRIVKTGLQRDGHYQVLEGLQPGEMAVADGAIFLSNMLQAPPGD